MVEGSYPATTGCDHEVFNPVLFASPTTSETDSPSGLNIKLSAPQFLGFAASPSELKAATVTLPPGLTINPDAADGQTIVHRSRGELRLRGASRMPRQLQDRHLRDRHPSAAGPLDGSVYIGEPKPGNQYRLFLVASGFGINAKLHRVDQARTR